MLHSTFAVLLLMSLAVITVAANKRYTPDWASLDSRPLPPWYDAAKFGIFSHWGVYSAPSVGDSETAFLWEYMRDNTSAKIRDFMHVNYKPGFRYQDFAPMFTAEFFDAHAYADIIKHSGAKYFVLTSKHVEGFTMWPSKYAWGWNSMDVGPHRDIVGELRKAFDDIGGVRMGLYYCLFEWFNPLYMKDKGNKFRTQEYIQKVTMPQMRELVSSYRPDVYWSDGDWMASSDYWNSTDFLAWLFNDSPVKDKVVVNDRWGIGSGGKHGSFYNFADQTDPGHLIAHKWENCMMMDRLSWGYRRDMAAGDVRTFHYLVTKLARTVSCGGNLLLNVGPTHYGRLIPIFEERLRQLGRFLQTNGEAVYGTRPWIYQNDTISGTTWYTSKLRHEGTLPIDRPFNPQDSLNTVVYAFVLIWPHDGVLRLGSCKYTSRVRATMLGHNHLLSVGPIPSGGIKIDLQAIPWHTLPSTEAWVIKLQHLADEDRDPLEEYEKMIESQRTN